MTLKKIVSKILFGLQVENINGEIHFRRSFQNYLWSRIKIVIYFLVLLIAIKTPLQFHFVKSAETFESTYDRQDLISRRDYLVEEVLDPSFSIHSMPFVLNDFFKGEWAFGTLSMTAIGLYNLSILYPDTKEYNRSKLKQIIQLALKHELRHFDSEIWGNQDALATLNGLDGHLGILGHLGLMISMYKQLSGTNEFDEIHHKIMDGLKLKLSQKCLLAETYPNSIFVPDNLTAIAALAMDPQMKSFTREWRTKARTILYDENGNFNFTLDSKCRPEGEPRGIGTSWNMFFMQYIDESEMEANYQKLIQEFVRMTPFGYKGVREWLSHSENTTGDIDSGPLVFGFSAVSTAFAVSGALKWGDKEFTQDIFTLTELLGWTRSWNQKRDYLFAPIVGDAILFATMTTPPITMQKHFQSGL